MHSVRCAGFTLIQAGRQALANSSAAHTNEIRSGCCSLISPQEGCAAQKLVFGLPSNLLGWIVLIIFTASSNNQHMHVVGRSLAGQQFSSTGGDGLARWDDDDTEEIGVDNTKPTIDRNHQCTEVPMLIIHQPAKLFLENTRGGVPFVVIFGFDRFPVKLHTRLWCHCGEVWNYALE